MGSAVMQLSSAYAGTMYTSPWLGGGLQSPSHRRGEYAESFPCAHGFGWGASAEHYGFSFENSLLASSLFEGFRLTLSRLQQEARSLSAHGVVGVKLSFEQLVGSPGTTTFLATGTAVVHRGSAPLHSPFLTNASGQNFERLVGLGYVAAGMALGIGVVYVHPNCLARGDLTAVGPNRQIPSAVGVARSRARSSLARTGHGMGQGVVHTEWKDVRFARYGEAWNQLALAFGTAVRRFTAETEPQIPAAVVSLRP
jgi:Putative heavy-metal-binding